MAKKAAQLANNTDFSHQECRPKCTIFSLATASTHVSSGVTTPLTSPVFGAQTDLTATANSSPPTRHFHFDFDVKEREGNQDAVVDDGEEEEVMLEVLQRDE